MLKIHKVSKKFNTNSAVKDLSLELKPGEIYSLIGPNGSGKTTIIKIIAGLLHSSTGQVYVDDYDVAKDPEKAKSIIGYIPDEPSIWPLMTGEEFLNFSGALFGVSEKKRQESIPPLLDIFGLKGVEKGYFEDYSRGNKQKFSILAALLHKPKLLLIDEPIVGLDPVSAEIAQKQFRKFVDDGGTILLVTHTLSVAEKISDRIGILRLGELIAEGTLNDLQHRSKLDSNASLDKVYKILAA